MDYVGDEQSQEQKAGGKLHCLGSHGMEHSGQKHITGMIYTKDECRVRKGETAGVR